MSEKKYVPRIAAVMVIALLTVGVCIALAVSAGSSKETALKQPEYMTKLFDKDKVIEVNIKIDEKDFDDLKENATEEQYYKADITIDGVTFNNVGIRAKGNSSLSQVAGDDTTDRYSFKIKADEYIDNQNIYGLSKFVLNNNIGDATNMKEYMSYDLLNQMGISTPGFAYANIKINDEDWGLYLAVESLEEEFIERNYGNTDGNLYKVESAAMGKDNEGGKMPEDMPSDMKEAMEQGGQGMMQEKNGQASQDNGQDQQMMTPPDGNGQAPQGNGQGQQMMTPPDGNGQASQGNGQMPEDAEGQQGEVKGGGGPGGMGKSGGNLIYSDDEISSYSNIFDYTILETTNKSDKKRLISILKNLNEGTNLDECIDVDEVLKYFAVNTFLVNLDSYAGNMKHNYYLYENDGKLQILPWDYNLSYGAFMMGGGGMGKGEFGDDSNSDKSKNSQASQVINFPIDKPVTDTMENSPLISKLLEVDEYKEKYHEYLQEIVDKYVNTGYFDEQIDKVDNLISDYVKNDKTAFFTYDEYKASLPNLKQYGVDRGKSIQEQLNGTQPSEDYGDLETTVDIKALGQQMGGGPKGNEEGGMPEMAKGPQGQANPEGSEEENKQNKEGRMMPPGMQAKSENNMTIAGMSVPVNVVIAGICFIVMIILTIILSKFRRKKVYFRF